jgi:3',5'-nucleoside bisphosphate phosphatase
MLIGRSVTRRERQRMRLPPGGLALNTSIILAVLSSFYSFETLAEPKKQAAGTLQQTPKELPWPTPLDQRACSREEIYFPAVGEFEVLKGDFHCHTIYSDGQVTPEVRVWESWRDGLDILSLTDHPEYMDLAIGSETGRAFARVRRLALDLGLILLPGAELTTINSSTPPFSDYAVSFITNELAMKGDFFAAIRSAREQGATVIWAHPGSNWTEEATHLLKQGWLDGIELRNAQTAGDSGTSDKEGVWFYPHVMDWCLQNNLSPFASSDAHWPITDYYKGQRRDMTLILARTRDQAGIKEAIQQRRTVAYFGEMLWGAERWVKGLAETAIQIKGTGLIRPKGQVFAVFVANQSSFPFKVLFSNDNDDAWFRPTEVRLAPRATTMVPFTLKHSETRVSSIPVTLKLSNVFAGRDRPVQLRRSLTGSFEAKKESEN